MEIVALSAHSELQVPHSAHLKARGGDVNLAGLPGTSPRLQMRGVGDLQVAVSGEGNDLHAAASVNVSHLAVNQARLDTAVARLDYQDGVLYVRSLRATDPLGRLTAAGTVGRKGELGLQVRAKGIDLAALLAPFTKQPAV